MQALKVASVAAALCALSLMPAHACDYSDQRASSTETPVAAAPATPEAGTPPASVAAAPAAEPVTASPPTQTAASAIAPAVTKPN